MLADDEAVECVVLGVDGVVDNLRAGGLHISSSTISVALSQRLAAAHEKAGQRFVAAPVLGRPDAAAAGKVFVIAGGERDAVSSAAPLLAAIGQKTFVVSDKPAAASLVRLSGEFLLTAAIELLDGPLAVVDGRASIDGGVSTP